MTRRSGGKTATILLALLTLALFHSTVASAQVAIRALAQDGALRDPFSRVVAVRELRDGQVMVLDANEESIHTVNFTTQASDLLGRKGSGPGEYRYPTRLLELGGDSFAVVDRGNARLLVVKGTGKLGGILGLMGLPIGNLAADRSAPPEASDRRGRLYAVAFSGFAQADDQSVDSAAIERWSIGAVRRDTIGYLPLAPFAQRNLEPGAGTPAYVTEPQWTVGPEGVVAIVYVKPYSIDLITPDGKRSKGRQIPYAPVPLTEVLKQEWKEDRARPRPVMILRPGANAVPAAGLRAMPQFEPIQWPRFLPPFLDDAIHFAPNDLVWVTRTTESGHAQIFDVLDLHGTLVERVSTPPHTRLVGFGKSHAYIIRIDADQQEFLERYLLAPSRQH